jgi:surface antigen
MIKAVIAIVVLNLSFNLTAKADKEDVGTAVGAIIGGILGNQVGHGSGRAAATIVGAIAGGVIGSKIGEELDEADRIKHEEIRRQAFVQNEIGRIHPWEGRRGYRGHVVINQVGYYRTETGSQECRQYTEYIYSPHQPAFTSTHVVCRTYSNGAYIWGNLRPDYHTYVVWGSAPVIASPQPYYHRRGIYCDLGICEDRAYTLRNGQVVVVEQIQSRRRITVRDYYSGYRFSVTRAQFAY